MLAWSWVVKTLPMTQRNMDDNIGRKTNDKIKIITMLKLRWPLRL